MQLDQLAENPLDMKRITLFDMADAGRAKSSAPGVRESWSCRAAHGSAICSVLFLRARGHPSSLEQLGISRLRDARHAPDQVPVQEGGHLGGGLPQEAQRHLLAPGPSDQASRSRRTTGTVASTKPKSTPSRRPAVGSL